MGARDVVNQTVAAPVAAVLEDYRAFLVGERGLAAESVRCYCNHARVFLAQLPDPVESELRGLSAGGVTAQGHVKITVCVELVTLGSRLRNEAIPLNALFRAGSCRMQPAIDGYSPPQADTVESP
jgi:hypothetical protein